MRKRVIFVIFISVCYLVMPLSTSNGLLVQRILAEQLPTFVPLTVFSQLKEITLKTHPSDEAPDSNNVIRANEKLIALKQWNDWVLVSKPVESTKPLGWMRLWHLSLGTVSNPQALKDLHRIVVGERYGKVGIQVAGDILYKVSADLLEKPGKLAVQQPTVKIFLVEGNHYFFEYYTEKRPSFKLGGDRLFTPEPMAIYEIKNKQPIKVGNVNEVGALRASIPKNNDEESEYNQIGISTMDIERVFEIIEH